MNRLLALVPFTQCAAVKIQELPMIDPPQKPLPSGLDVKAICHG